MGVLLILLLCSYTLLCSANQALSVEADCDDVKVLEAVDVALRSYNEAKDKGNQFVLYRITDAKLKNDGGDETHYYVEHEIREGSCGVKSGKTWQECAFLESNAVQSKCSAHIVVQNEQNLKSVVSQNCSSTQVAIEPPVTAVLHQCLGCHHPVDVNNEELLRIVHYTIKDMNTRGNHPFYFGLETIVNATRQVVRGWNYNIVYLIRQTNCLKNISASINETECNTDKNGESGTCNVIVYIAPDSQVNDFQLECKLETGICISCPVTVDPQDPALLSLLNQVMDEYNSKSNHTELYSITTVQHATKQGFHKLLYDLTFTVKPTNCSKPDYTILGDECDFTPDAEALKCHTEISVTDMTMNVLSAPRCYVAQTIHMRISGFSPLRRAAKKKLNITTKPNKGTQRRTKRHEDHRQQKHERKEKKHKPKHGYKDEDDSSEELVNNGNKISVSNSAATPVVDVLEPHSTVGSRCPGKVWQPISLVPENPTVQTFTIDDLEFALEDLAPLPSQDTEKNEDVKPKEVSFFNDEDLLDLLD